MILGLDGTTLLIGAGIGLVVGSILTIYFVEWVRCSNCCWTEGKPE